MKKINFKKEIKKFCQRNFQRFWQMRIGSRDIPCGRIVIAVLLVIPFFNLGVRLFQQGAPDDVTEKTKTESKIEYWSCSMHPQVKLPEAGLCPICNMDLIPVYAGEEDEPLSEVSLTLNQTARRLAEVETVPVSYETVFNEIRLVGKIDYDETRLAHISAWTGGRIDRLYADFTGTEIGKGSPMIELYSPELISAQEEYLQALGYREKMNGKNDISEFNLRSAEETVLSAEKKLRLLGVEEQEIREIAEEGSWRERLIIRSPVSGTVIERRGFVGQYVELGEKIYTVADLDYVWLYLEAYEGDIQWLRNGQEVTVEVEAYPGEVHTGEISFIDPVVDEKTRTVGVRVEIPNEEGKLKPGMFADVAVRVPFQEKAPVLLIPASAALLTGKRSIVYVERPHMDGLSLYEGREVRLGPRVQDKYVVYSGLEEGEKVVVKGNFKIDSAMQIMARPSMMAPLGYYTDTDEDSVLMKRPVHFSEDAAILASSMHHYLEASAYMAEEVPGQAAKQLEHFKEGLMDALAEYEPVRGEGLVPDIQKMIQQVSETGETLQALRVTLREISLVLMEILREHEYREDVMLHLVFCPMAFDDEGAYWFQKEEEIANPYFGPAMLRCGEIEEVFGRGKIEEKLAAPAVHQH